MIKSVLIEAIIALVSNRINSTKTIVGTNISESLRHIPMGMTFFLAAIMLTYAKPSLAQDKLPPDYLANQDFPDSVLNLKLVSISGEPVSFSSLLDSYKGKKVVVDIWASYCKDCIVGLPKLEKLKRKTGVDNVVYLFISVDKWDDKWKKAIDHFNIQGEHYRIEGGWDNLLSNYIELDWIPRYLVLSENGRIIVPKAITADNPQMAKSLLK